VLQQQLPVDREVVRSDSRRAVARVGFDVQRGDLFPVSDLRFWGGFFWVCGCDA
jgi:hypothetical protein